MIYREIEVPDAMAHAVLCAWQFVLEPSDPALVQHQIPPDGTTNLVLVGLPTAPSIPTELVRAWPSGWCR